MVTLESIGADIQSVLSKIQQLEEKINQSKINHPVSTDDDLIDRFVNELMRLEVVDHFDVRSYKQDQIKNKSAYYFDNLDNITNRRAYLTKLVSQLDLCDTVSSVISEDLNTDVDTTTVEFMLAVSDFEKLTISQIYDIRARHLSISRFIGGTNYSMLSDKQKYFLVVGAQLDGIL